MLLGNPPASCDKGHAILLTLALPGGCLQDFRVYLFSNTWQSRQWVGTTDYQEEGKAVEHVRALAA